MQEFINNNLVWVLALVAWSLIWKGFALWSSARHGHKVWFVVLLVVNTLGLLEIVYLFTPKPAEPAAASQV